MVELNLVECSASLEKVGDMRRAYRDMSALNCLERSQNLIKEVICKVRPRFLSKSNTGLAFSLGRMLSSSIEARDTKLLDDNILYGGYKRESMANGDLIFRRWLLQTVVIFD